MIYEPFLSSANTEWACLKCNTEASHQRAIQLFSDFHPGRRSCSEINWFQIKDWRKTSPAAYYIKAAELRVPVKRTKRRRAKLYNHISLPLYPGSWVCLIPPTQVSRQRGGNGQVTALCGLQSLLSGPFLTYRIDSSRGRTAHPLPSRNHTVQRQAGRTRTVRSCLRSMTVK